MSRPSTNGSSIRSASRRSMLMALAFETTFGQNVARSGIRKCSGSRDGPCAPTVQCPPRCEPHSASTAMTIGCRGCCTLRRRRNCGAWRTRLDATFCQASWRRRRRPTDRSSRGGEADAIPASSRNCRSEHGWLLRRLPRFMTTPGATTLLPLFSLISSAGDRRPVAGAADPAIQTATRGIHSRDAHTAVRERRGVSPLRTRRAA
jgi:hypothetical protein